MKKKSSSSLTRVHIYVCFFLYTNLKNKHRIDLNAKAMFTHAKFIL